MNRHFLVVVILGLMINGFAFTGFPSGACAKILVRHNSTSAHQLAYSYYNGVWKDIATGRTERLSNIYKINYLNAVDTDTPYACFNIKDKPTVRVLITKGSYDLNGDGVEEEATVLYWNFKLKSYNDHDDGPQYAENFQWDNIAAADAVYVKISR